VGLLASCAGGHQARSWKRYGRLLGQVKLLRSEPGAEALKKILIDGSTLAAATGLVFGDDQPSALNLFALGLIVESIILHDTTVVLDTSKIYPSRLVPMAARYGESVVVHSESTEELIATYAALECPAFAQIIKQGGRVYMKDERRWDAVAEARDAVDEVLLRSYPQDNGVNSYLAELEAFFLGLNKMPRRQLDERGLIAADGMEQAGDEIMRSYAAVPSMWTLTHGYENREKYSKFTPGLLLRTHFYLMVSDVLGMPYRPDALRTPICWKFFGRGSFADFGTDERFVDAAERMTQERVRSVNDFLGRDAFVIVPFFLASVLAKAQSVADIVPISLDIRASAPASRFRKYVAKLQEVEAGADITTLSRELLKYAEFLRAEFGAASQWSPDSALSLLSSGVTTALAPTPDRFVSLAANLSKSATGAQKASKRWWYRRKLALISKTIRTAGKAQALTNQVERLFQKKVSKDEVAFFQTILTGPTQGP
jgi:hypothetical protein